MTPRRHRTACAGAGLGWRSKQRKLMPTVVERLIWGYGDGSTMLVFDPPRGKLDAVICWENYMPLLRMAMYGTGMSRRGRTDTVADT